jgi:SAM-dependent methyltransferase
MNNNQIVKQQREYWREVAKEHEGTVQAVGSESELHKKLRYKKIAEIFNGRKHISVHDIGAGVGDFYSYLRTYVEGGGTITYSASEITPEYCEIARNRHPEIKMHNRDLFSKPIEEFYDYVVMSGVFHQQGNVPHREWIRYMHDLLRVGWNMATRGLAFNVLSAHADFYKPGNFYADLNELQLFVLRNLSRFYQIDTCYPLFDATIHVFRPSEISENYPEAELQRYLTND